MVVNIQNSHYIHQHVKFQGPPKCTQIGILGIKNTIWQSCSQAERQKKA
jgi:hypothetical protein